MWKRILDMSNLYGGSVERRLGFVVLEEVYDVEDIGGDIGVSDEVFGSLVVL